MAEDREYAAVVEELERAFDHEREAVSKSDPEEIARLLSEVEELLVELMEAVRRADPLEAAKVLKWAARRREENASLLRARMVNIGSEIHRLRESRKAAMAYSPPGYKDTGFAVDRNA